MKRKKNLSIFKTINLNYDTDFTDFSKTVNTIFYLHPKKLFQFFFFFKQLYFLFSFFNVNSISFFFFLKKNYFNNKQKFYFISKQIGIQNLDIFENSKKHFTFFKSDYNFIKIKTIILLNFFFNKLFILG